MTRFMGPTPITSSKKKTTPCGWFSFWNYRGRESEGGQKKPRWGFCPPLGSASKRERSSWSKFPEACAEAPITSSKKKTTSRGWFSFWNSEEGSRSRGRKLSGGQFSAARGAQARGNAAHGASSPKLARRLPSPAPRVQVSPFRDPSLTLRMTSGGQEG